MKKRNRTIIKQQLITALCLCLMISVYPFGPGTEICAASPVKISSASSCILCGSTAVIRKKTGKKYKYSSSNKKVATISAKGKIKALRLGETTITVRKGKKTKAYKLTVIPKKSTDLYLNPSVVLRNQKFQLKILSDKYDTSQIHARYTSGYSGIKKTGACNGLDSCGWGTVTFGYGKYKQRTKLKVIDPQNIYTCVTQGALAGNTIQVQCTAADGSVFTPSALRKNGIQIKINDVPITDSIVFYPGTHTISILADNITFSKSIRITYSMKKALKLRNSEGFLPDERKVLDHIFSVMDEIIEDGMTEKEKVKAIHDYLIFHANYYNDGDVSNVPGWAYSAQGVLLKGEGVCNSYSLAFCIMATTAGLNCHYVRGSAAPGSGPVERHAWNRVQINQEWYYLDCTWDDPTGGGYENYKYYLSKPLWRDHQAQEEYNPMDKDMSFWHTFYLTGKGWDK